MDFKISIRSIDLFGQLELAENAKAFVVFVYSSDSDVFLYEKELVSELKTYGINSVRCKLLINDEERLPENVRVNLLTERLIALSRWCLKDARFVGLKQGYFCTGWGSAIALSTSAYWGTKVGAVVSYNGRPDGAMEELDLVEAPVLLMAIGGDEKLKSINKQSYQKMGCVKKMEIISEVNNVVVFAVNWFRKYLTDNVS